MGARRRAAASGAGAPGALAQGNCARLVTPSELPAGADNRPAAVLCLLFEEAGQANVVLTRRSAHLRAHAGEVSFPGGRLRLGELARDAALREAHEEIGLDSGRVELIGELSPLSTQASSALVRCFVGTFPAPGPGALRASEPEVERVFSVPLGDLAADGVFHEELWPAGHDGPSRPTGQEHLKAGRFKAVPFFVLEDETVWGATGRLLSELLSLVLDSRHACGPIEDNLAQK